MKRLSLAGTRVGSARFRCQAAGGEASPQQVGRGARPLDAPQLPAPAAEQQRADDGDGRERDRDREGHADGSKLATHRQHVRQRSEEHTSELQSRSDLVCRLLLEKKKKTTDYDSLGLYGAQY